VTAVFAPFVELVKTWDLPGWLVHWGHPGNMVRTSLAVSPELQLKTWAPALNSSPSHARLWCSSQWVVTGHTWASGSNYQTTL
jgi:hypothetical protein